MTDFYVEDWKDIPGYEGEYQASTRGRIRRLEHVKKGSGRRSSAKIITASRISDGHYQVGLHGRRFLVHYLVLLTFVGPRPADKPHIRHLDDNPANNRLDNIVYGTAQENALDRERARKADGSSFRYSKERALKIKEALEARLEWTYAEMLKLAESFGVSLKTVRRIKSGEAWSGSLVRA